MAKHTPGKWNASRELDGSWVVYASDPSEYAEPGALMVVAEYLTEANAHLIESAPDLLEACEQLLHHASLGPDEVGSQQWDEDCEKMRAAIARAKGGE